MIIIKNSQRKIRIEPKKIENYITQILEIFKYENFDVSIWFTTNTTIRKFNKNFRKKDKPTDILSFPFYPELKPGQRIKIDSKKQNKQDLQKQQNKQYEQYEQYEQVDEQNLGDIIISLEYAKKYADQNNINFDQHLKLLLVHGMCHLIGYDHETEHDYKIMHKLEESILKKLK